MLKKNTFNIFIILSIGLHTLVLALISNFSKNFISPESSIIEIKIEEYSENMELSKSKEILKPKISKLIKQNFNKKQETNNQKNDNSIKDTQNNLKTFGYQNAQRTVFEKNKLNSSKDLSESPEKVSLNILSPDYQMNKKQSVTNKSRAKFQVGSHNNPHPEYPLIARKRGWEGRVIIRADIDKSGIVTSIKILKSSGFEVLDEASLVTLRQWKFTPARYGDKFIHDSLNIPVNFRLKD